MTGSDDRDYQEAELSSFKRSNPLKAYLHHIPTPIQVMQINKRTRQHEIWSRNGYFERKKVEK